MKHVMTTTALAALAALGGCDRTHMSPHFGEANRDAFAAQVIDPDAGNDRKPNPPLDPEEAAAISKGYVKSLSPPGAVDTTPRSPILVVPAGPPGGAAPPPVPEPPR